MDQNVSTRTGQVPSRAEPVPGVSGRVPSGSGHVPSGQAVFPAGQDVFPAAQAICPSPRVGSGDGATRTQSPAGTQRQSMERDLFLIIHGDGN